MLVMTMVMRLLVVVSLVSARPQVPAASSGQSRGSSSTQGDGGHGKQKAAELDAALVGLPSTHLSDDAAWASHTLLFTELRSRNTSRALPHFYVLGAAKAGSTDLYAHICEHPRVDCSGPRSAGCGLIT